jgi:hypothetical protein
LAFTILPGPPRSHAEATAAHVFEPVVPGKPLAIVVRIDYAYGRRAAALTVDGHPLADVSIPDRVDVDRWRNWLYGIVPGDRVSGSPMRVAVTGSDGRDHVAFTIWILQFDA